MDQVQEKVSRVQAIRIAAMAVLQHEAAGKSPADADAYQAHVDLGNSAETIMKVLAERDCLLETLKDVLASARNMYLHFQPNMAASDQRTRCKLLQEGDTTVMLIEGEHLTGSGSRHYVIHTVGDTEPVLNGPYLSEHVRDGVAGVLRLDNEHDGLYKLDINERGQIVIDSFTGGEMEQLVDEAAMARLGY